MGMIRLGFLKAPQKLCKRETPGGELSGVPQLKYYADLEDFWADDIRQLGARLDEAVENPYECPTTAVLTDAGQAALASGRGIRRKFVPEPDYDDPHVARSASRVLLIDIDGIVCADERWREDLAGFAREVVQRLLPPRFHDVSFWASLSASAGIKNNDDGDWVVGLHVVFVIDRPLEGKLRQLLVKLDAPEALDRHGKVDLGALLCSQLFYTARPELRREDPAPIRSALVEGQTDVVALEPGLEARLVAEPTSRPGTRAGGHRPTQGVQGYEAKMTLLGDGPGLYGFHEVLRDAIFAIVAEHKGEVHECWLKEDIRRRIDEAPKGQSRTASAIMGYKSDKYLDASIRGAIARIKAERLAPRAFDIPTDTMDEAREELATAISRFEQIAAYDGPVEYLQVGPDEWEPWPPYVMGIETPTGSGKTQVAIETTARLVKDHGKRVVFAAPTHKLGDELVARFHEHGIRATVYRGLSADDPEVPGSQMCRISDAVETLRSGGVSLTKLCKVCPHSGACGMHRQMALRPETDVWIVPNNLLASARPKHTIPPCDVLIADEDPINAFLTGFDGDGDVVSPAALRRRAGSGSSHLAQSRRRLAAAVETGKIAYGRFGDPHRLARLVLEETERIEIGDFAQLDGQLQAARENRSLRIEAAAWKAIAAGGVGLRIVHVDGPGGEQQRVLRVHRKRGLTKDWQVDTLLLDATPEWDLCRQIWDIDDVVTITTDMPNAYVRQVLFGASKTKLDDSDVGKNNVRRLHRYIQARAFGRRKVLVVSQLSTEEKLLALGLPSQVETAHFNAVRGMDKWLDADLVIAIGRAEPPPAAMELAAEVLFQEPVERLEEGSYYPRVSAGLNTRGGGERTDAVRTTRHPDDRVEAFRRRATQNEIVQAVGRGRGGNRGPENPIQIDLINEIPLPIAVDEVVSWENAQPTPADLVAGRHGIVIEDQSARGAAKLIDALLPDVATSRASLRRARAREPSLFHLPNKDPYKGDETVRAPRRARAFVPDARYAVQVRFKNALWRPLRDGEVPHPKAEQRRFLGKTYVLEPFGLSGPGETKVYLAKENK